MGTGHGLTPCRQTLAQKVQLNTGQTRIRQLKFVNFGEICTARVDKKLKSQEHLPLCQLANLLAFVRPVLLILSLFDCSIGTFFRMRAILLPKQRGMPGIVPLHWRLVTTALNQTKSKLHQG